MFRRGWNLKAFVFSLLMVFMLGSTTSCIVRTNARTGKHRHGVRHKHRHCHQKKVHKRDHRKKGRDHRKKRVCHSHVHGHPHH
jgi:hypothetical protein